MTNDHREQAREIVRLWADEIPDVSWWIGFDVLTIRNLPYELDTDDLINRIATSLSSRDAEIKEVLEGLRLGGCWCPKGQLIRHSPVCLVARALYDKLNSDAPAPASNIIPKPPRRKSKKEQVADELRESDLTALETDRRDIEYGPHDSLPSGQHVARIKRG